MGQIRSECQKFKSKNKGVRDNKKDFKVTWDDSSKFKREEEKEEVANLCFMALKNDIEVPSTSNSSFDNDCDDYCDDDDDDDESSIVSKLLLICKSLLSKKKHYKHELTNLTKEFKHLKNKFSSLVKSNDKLVCDLKILNFLEDQLKKVNG